MKKASIMTLLFLLVIFTSCQKPPSQMTAAQHSNATTISSSSGFDSAPATSTDMAQQSASNPIETTPNLSGIVIHLNTTIAGKVNKINIDLDVHKYPKIQLGIYNAKPMVVDQNAWMQFFFKDIDKSKLTQYYANWSKKYLDLDQITDDVIRNTFGYEYGDVHDPDIEAYYLINQSLFEYNKGLKRQDLEDKCTISADQTKMDKAKELSDNFMRFVAGDRVLRSSCVVAQTDPDRKEVYVSEYNRTIDGFPVVLDTPLQDADAPDPIRIDHGVVWVMNDSVVYSMAILRDLELVDKKQIISLDQALSILQKYIDIVNAYSKDFTNGKSKISEFNIQDFSLMYYPVLVENNDIAKTYAGKRAYATYRPVWYISSGQRVNTNLEFVMIIDAITGEVIG